MAEFLMKPRTSLKNHSHHPHAPQTVTHGWPPEHGAEKRVKTT